jgi:hypothetical protein
MPYSTKDPSYYPPEFEIFLRRLGNRPLEELLIPVEDKMRINGRRIQMQSFFKAVRNYVAGLEVKLLQSRKKGAETDWIEKELVKWAELGKTAARLVVRAEATGIRICPRTAGSFGEAMLGALGEPEGGKTELERLQDEAAEWFWTGRGLPIAWSHDREEKMRRLREWLPGQSADITPDNLEAQVQIIASLAVEKEWRASGRSLMEKQLTA